MDNKDIIKNRLVSTKTQIGDSIFTSSSYKPGKIQHIVLFRFDDAVSDMQIAEVVQRFLQLKTECKRDEKPYILELEAGKQSSGEGVSGGFEYAFIVTFASEGDRNYYVGTPIVNQATYYDPAHQAFKDFVGPLLAKENGVLVFDFTVQK